MVSRNNGASGQRSARTGLDPRWPRVALAIAGTWSLLYLALGIAWLMGGPGNPADPAVDEGAALSLLGSLGPVTGAVTVTTLAALGVLLAGAMRFLPSAAGRFRLVHRLVVGLAGSLGVILAVVLPDYRLLATIAYTPILLVLAVFGAAPPGASLWEWPVVNMAILTLAGLCWIAAAEMHHRKTARVGTETGQGRRGREWTTSATAARWGRWATAVAVVVPLGYAVTRFAWALGIPLGVDQELLDDLGNRVYLGAGLGTLGVAGAILTLGLVQQWGEVFPGWMLGYVDDASRSASPSSRQRSSQSL